MYEKRSFIYPRNVFGAGAEISFFKRFITKVHLVKFGNHMGFYLFTGIHIGKLTKINSIPINISIGREQFDVI